MLTIKNISKGYNQKEVVKSLSLQVAKGEIVAIIGPSGAGKTTLLRCISLLERPESGSWKYNGFNFSFPFKGKVPASIYPQLTVVFQQHFLWPNMSNRDNVCLALKNGDDSYSRIIQSLCLENKMDSYPHEVSVGERQRIALARALVVKPEILLLDEITSSLDTRNIKIIEKMLLSLKKNGTGILAVTHNIDFARNIADRVIYMENGVMLENIISSEIDSSKCIEFRKFINGEF